MLDPNYSTSAAYDISKKHVYAEKPQDFRTGIS
jgi:hypothetical protein